jgi:cobalamin biosynthesis Mg chelatase CobN
VRRLFVAGAFALASLALLDRPALAACHHFTVTVAPATVTEGGAVTVTVSRDGSVGGSHVDLSTIDETAKAGQDYTAVRQTVSFTTELSKTLQLHTTDDAAVEGGETLRLHLSNPGGCVNTNYVLDPDAKVTIADNDNATPTTRAAGASSTARASSTIQSSSTSRSTTGVTTTVGGLAADSTSPSVLGEGRTDNKGGGAGAAVLIVGLIAVIAAAGGYLFYRSRRTSP